MGTSSGAGAATAREFLIGHLGRQVEAFEWVGEGAWSRCFGFRDRGRDLVVRFGRHLEDFEKDRRAAGFASVALPVPEMLEVGRAPDGYFAISSRARGEPLETLDVVGLRAVLPFLLGALDAARRIDLSDTTGYGGWDAEGRAPYASWRDFLLAVDVDTPDRRTHGWRRKLIDSPLGDGSFRAGLKRLGELTVGLPEVRHLVHADLINRNVLVSSGQLSGVFDWGCSCYGDFLYDIAWLAFWAPWYEALDAIDICGEARLHYDAIGLEVPELDARLRCCMLHIGLDHLAYNAHTGNMKDLVEVNERLLPLLD